MCFFFLYVIKLFPEMFRMLYYKKWITKLSMLARKFSHYQK